MAEKEIASKRHRKKRRTDWRGHVRLTFGKGHTAGNHLNTGKEARNRKCLKCEIRVQGVAGSRNLRRLGVAVELYLEKKISAPCFYQKLNGAFILKEKGPRNRGGGGGGGGLGGGWGAYAT